MRGLSRYNRSMRPDEIWEGKQPNARLIRSMLLPLSWLYGAGWQGYLAIYRLGLKRSKHPHSPILCVGNLVTGGSGKSPVTLFLASRLIAMGKPFVIGCSGYGAPRSENAQLAPEGPLDAAEWGDEPAMIRWLLPTVPLVVGRNRVMAAQLVHQFYAGSLLLMDDGFQHLPLKKTASLVLDESPKNSHCLPAGPYREPRSNRKRADRLIPDDFQVHRLPLRFIAAEGGQDVRPEQYSVLCALGQPNRFLAQLRVDLPNSLKEPMIVLLNDHDRLDAPNLLSRFPIDTPIVVTAKDWVKLRGRGDISAHQFVIALQNISLEPLALVDSWLEGLCSEK